MPLTRNQKSAGAADVAFERPTPAQLKTQLRSLDLSNYIALGSYPASTSSVYSQTLPSSNIQIQELLDNPSSFLPGNSGLAENLNLLLIHHWIRIFVAQNTVTTQTILRIYLLPDDVAETLIVRDSAKLRSALRGIISSINCTSSAWNFETNTSSYHESASYISASEAADSLYYLFNNVSAPAADPERLDKDVNYYATKDILDNSSNIGLITKPYEYQQQSAAAMLSREAEPQWHIDPRFEQKTGPTGETFDLDAVESSIVKTATHIEDVRGGILAENMGAGKTLISIILILATRGHLPKLPSSGTRSTSFNDANQGPGTRSLKEITSRAIRLYAVPYKSELEKRADVLLRYLDANPASYSPFAGQTKYLSSTTLIVVPPNLIPHWSNELDKHVKTGTLAVYTALNDDQALPTALDLLKYDVLLISKQRFEDEFTPRQSSKRQQAGEDDSTNVEGLVCACSKKRRACAVHPYTTPLVQTHFLRVIVDEALGFSKSSLVNKASAAMDKLKAERRWLISGTPSKGLRGIEIDMAIEQNADDNQDVNEKQALQDRRARPSQETEEEQIKNFGNIVTNFFKAKPWHGRASQAWTRYMMPDKYGKGKPGNLQAVVESLVVRHQMQHVDEEVRLPPLSNKVVYLDACPMDKMALNLFTVQLIFNAVTSEREDQDYMFHKSQKKHLASLFQNLRNANFYWTGHGQIDLLKSIETAERYLAKDDTKASDEDRALLLTAIDIGRKTLENPQWQAASASKEMALFVEGFPDDLQHKYAMTSAGYRHPLIMTSSHVRQTQDEVAKWLFAQDPFNTLWRSAGDEVWRSIVRAPQESPGKKRKAITVKGVSSATYESNDASPTPKRRKSTPKKKEDETSLLPPIVTPKLKSALKSGPSKAALPPKHQKAFRPHLVATASSKLSYLIDQLMGFYKDEKTIVFYEDANIGYWLAQTLEILEITHEIYAAGIKEKLRSQYLQDFENGDHIRVLLMDLRLGSHGLHLASVTRVFFVNPVWDETVEAQAIKRAHRTGQTKPVFIETLVLKGTLEDQMLKRRKNMTAQELQQTSKGPTSDPAMHDIIKNATFLPMSDDEWRQEELQCAPLKKQYQLYGREFIGHPDLLNPIQVPTPAATPPRVTTIKIRNLPKRPVEAMDDASVVPGAKGRRANSVPPAEKKPRAPLRRVYSAPITPPSALEGDTVILSASSPQQTPQTLGDRNGLLALLAKLADIPTKRQQRSIRKETVFIEFPSSQAEVPAAAQLMTKWKRPIDDVEASVVQVAPKKKKGLSWAT